MSKKNVLISLGDSRIKEISEVLQNKTCNKILEYISEKDATVSDISNFLKIPINTADYNVKKLVSTGLIESSAHFWSVKGKRMPTYKVSNKKIIISPKRTKNLTSLILALASTGVIALLVKKFTATKEIVYDTAPAMLRAVNDVSSGAVRDASNISFIHSIVGWEWFLVGAWFAIFIFFIFSIIDERRKNKNV